MPRARPLCLLPLVLTLGACHAVVLAPAGDVAAQQGHLVIVSTVLMLLIVLPVMALTALFAWRYRSSAQARYEPEWDHATHLELIIWAAPLLIIICLGALTWAGTHLLDPFRPLARLTRNQPLPAGTRALTVEVVALDWKWLFIYPQLKIATVNELDVPLDTPLDFRLTSSSVMNSFYVPALAGQIYTMPGMQTRLHAVLNRPGDYAGFSANYSGAGFSGMRFTLHGVAPQGFQRWVSSVRAAGGRLDRAQYLELARPSENEPVRHYAAVEPTLYASVLQMCVAPGEACTGAMARADSAPLEVPVAKVRSAALTGAGLPPPGLDAGARTTAALEPPEHP